MFSDIKPEIETLRVQTFVLFFLLLFVTDRYFSRRLKGFTGINKLLRISPVKIVVLLRLPYLGSGFMNYLFSMSKVRCLPNDQHGTVRL